MDAGTLTVAQLARGIEAALSTWFAGELWVTGSIANLRRSSNGHVYFQLVELDDDQRAAASVDVTLFDSARRFVNSQLKAAGGVRMTDGMQVRLRGRIELYAPQGRVQLRMSGIDPAYTLALLVSERDRVVALLGAEGLLGRNAAATLAALPLRVGLATSDGSAAMADFVDELRASTYAWRITLAHVAVQGPGSDHAIADAIDRLVDTDVDVVVLVRGGGSRLDLATFDSEAVARAIAGSPVPVFTGIGHEIDTSVADVAAHSSFKTPTACAAALVDHVAAASLRAETAWSEIPGRASRLAARLDADLLDHVRRLPSVARAHLDTAAVRVEARSRASAGRVLMGLTEAHADLGRRHAQLAPRADRVLERAERRLAVCEAAAEGADPVRLMQRGWSITRTGAGSVVRSAADVAAGTRLRTELVDGVIDSDVVRTQPRSEATEGTPR
jgi:exodeoxyribonuclease VII large subunit